MVRHIIHADLFRGITFLGLQLGRMSDASNYMMDAFLGPQAKPINIFALAKDLAEGMEPPEDLMKTPVSRNIFIAEVEVSWALRFTLPLNRKLTSRISQKHNLKVP